MLQAAATHLVSQQLLQGQGGQNGRSKDSQPPTGLCNLPFCTQTALSQPDVKQWAAEQLLHLDSGMPPVWDLLSSLG